ncbi:MAG TPA: hypothetical protein VNU49_03825 [Opitutaceae bacterium]|jgi:hypothetical protein|nr:hypothetical protein [Opitutaceae bacterium]
MRFPPAILLGLLPLAFNLGHAAENAPAEPAKNFILPTFTREGYYSMRLCGSEARMLTLHLIELDDMNLTVFSGDASNRVDSVLLSPMARVSLDNDTARGPGAIRLIRDDLELTGEQWTYDHAKKSISIADDVRVVFHSELSDLLK